MAVTAGAASPTQVRAAPQAPRLTAGVARHSSSASVPAPGMKRPSSPRPTGPAVTSPVRAPRVPRHRPINAGSLQPGEPPKATPATPPKPERALTPTRRVSP